MRAIAIAMSIWAAVLVACGPLQETPRPAADDPNGYSCWGDLRCWKGKEYCYVDTSDSFSTIDCRTMPSCGSGQSSCECLRTNNVTCSERCSESADAVFCDAGCGRHPC